MLKETEFIRSLPVPPTLKAKATPAANILTYDSTLQKPSQAETQWYNFCSSSNTVEFGLRRIRTGFLFKQYCTANFQYSVISTL